MCERNEQPTRLITSTPLKSLLLSMIVLMFDVVSIMSSLRPVISTFKDDKDDLTVEFRSSAKRISTYTQSNCSPSLSPNFVINSTSVASTPSHLRSKHLLQFVIFLDFNLSVRSSQGSAVGI